MLGKLSWKKRLKKHGFRNRDEGVIKKRREKGRKRLSVTAKKK